MIKIYTLYACSDQKVCQWLPEVIRFGGITRDDNSAQVIWRRVIKCFLILLIIMVMCTQMYSTGYCKLL